MKTTRALGVVFAATMTLGLAACGDKGGGGAASATQSAKASTASGTAAASATASAAPASTGSAAASKPKPNPLKEAAAGLSGKFAPAATAIPAASAAPADTGTATASPATPPAPAGTWAAIPGTDGEVMLPADWKAGEVETWLVAGSANETAGFLASTYAKGTDPTELIGNAAQAAQFSHCEWQGQTTIKLGDAEMDANVADGVCLDSSGVWNYVMYALVGGGDINVFLLGGWDENAGDADAQMVMNIFRSLRQKGG